MPAPLTYLLSLIAGAATPLGIAPLNYWPLSILALALYAYNLHQATHSKACLWHGFVFGLGYFGVGVSWVFISIHEYGSAPFALALLLTSLFIAFLALVFSLPFYAYGKFQASHWRLLLGFPLLWAFSEWLRSWLLTGFPWLLLGYSQLDTPLAGWAPIGGVLLVGLLAAFTSSALVILLNRSQPAPTNIRWLSVIAVVIFWAEGSALKSVEWTEAAGEPLTVGLVQPNIPLELKWDPAFRQDTVDILWSLSEDLWEKDWVIWPEAAIPDIYSRSTEFLEFVDQQATQSQTSLITGVLYDDFDQDKYFNATLGLGQASGRYHKQRLVPFGEYVPLESWLRGLIQFFDLPNSILSTGANEQELVIADKYQVASSICYEIVYPDLVAQLTKNSHVILTISNDAWFGASLGPLQHLHMTRMRALETGRYVIRGTNNGVSAIIKPTGEISLQSEQFVRTNISGEFTPMQGNTPYILWRDYLVLGMLVLGLVALILIQRNRTTSFELPEQAANPE